MTTLYLNRRNNGRRQNGGEPASEKVLPLGGNWCWDADPFQVTEETKAMVMRTICYLLNSFLHRL